MLESENIQAEQPAENIAEGAALQQEILLTKTGTDSLGTTANDKLQNDDMEVHKHPHHVTHKKKWGEYLLEFFMLFLAVFLGFVAENIRENYVERHREKEYIESLLNDVRADTAMAGGVLRDFTYRQPHIDSILNNFEAMLNGNAEIFAKYRSMGIIGFEDFNPADGTMQQLKNAGGLRLIQNRKVVNSILKYDATTKLLFIESNHLAEDKYHEYWNSEGSFINKYKIDTLKKRYGASWFNYAGDLFTTTDLQKRLEFYAKLKYVQAAGKPWLELLVQYTAQGERLIELLKKEYHLENE